MPHRLQPWDYTAGTMWVLYGLLETDLLRRQISTPILTLPIGVIAGVIGGWFLGRRLVKKVELSGEWKSRNPRRDYVLTIGSAIAVIVVVVWFVLFSGIPMSTMTIFLSALVWAPAALWLTRPLYLYSWEKRTGRRLYFDDFFNPRFYTLPRFAEFPLNPETQ